jgi:predicted alpha/beta superfamily hydrolase
MKIENYNITFFEGNKLSKLVVFIHEDKSIVEKIFTKIEEIKPTIVCIEGTDRNSDFSPSSASIKLFGKTTNFSGNASQYLLFFKNVLFPRCLKELKIIDDDSYKFCICGYSLAGLFAVYSIFYSNLFSYCLSCSSSLWFPNFVDSIKGQKVSNKLEFTYFSLGDEEEKSKNPLISMVRFKTNECIDIFKNQNVKTLFEMNNGGHFKDVELRILKAVNNLIKFDSL